MCLGCPPQYAVAIKGPGIVCVPSVKPWTPCLSSGIRTGLEDQAAEKLSFTRIAFCPILSACRNRGQQDKLFTGEIHGLHISTDQRPNP